MKKFMQIVSSVIVVATVGAVIPSMGVASVNADARVESNLIETKTGYNNLDWCACEVLDFLADLAKLELNKSEKKVKESDKDEVLKAEALKNIEEARKVIADIKAEIANMKNDIKEGQNIDAKMRDVEAKIKGDMSEATSKVSEMMTNF